MENTKSLLDRFIQTLYFGGTRSVRVINLITSLTWLIALFLHSTTDFQLALPMGINNQPHLAHLAHLAHPAYSELGPEVRILIIMSLLSTVTAGGSLMLRKYRHCLKYVSLHAGALTQALISAAYTAGYPPLTMTAVTSIIMALWFLGAAYFVMEEPEAATPTQTRRDGGDGNAHRRNFSRVG